MKEYEFYSELEACSPFSVTESQLLDVAHALVTCAELAYTQGYWQVLPEKLLHCDSFNLWNFQSLKFKKELALLHAAHSQTSFLHRLLRRGLPVQLLLCSPRHHLLQWPGAGGGTCRAHYAKKPHLCRS